MEEGSRITDMQLERDLRRLLGARAHAAPMPPGVAEIPPRWLTPRRGLRLARVGGVAALLAATALLIVVLTQLPRIVDVGQLPSGVGVSAESAAAHLGVPASQVVLTRDGAVGLRLVDGVELEAQLLLVRPTSAGPETQLLTQVPVPPGLLDPNTALVWSEQLSCAPERGLEQPNFLFGAAPSPEKITVSVPARATQQDRLFIVVLEATDLRGQVVRLATDGGPFDERFGLLFERRDACTGELPHPHGRGIPPR